VPQSFGSLAIANGPAMPSLRFVSEILKRHQMRNVRVTARR